MGLVFSLIFVAMTVLGALAIVGAAMSGSGVVIGLVVALVVIAFLLACLLYTSRCV